MVYVQKYRVLGERSKLTCTGWKAAEKPMKPMYLTMQDMLLGWLVGRLQNEAKERFWRVVVAVTTLSDTLIEIQLFELTLFMKRNFNTSGTIVQFFVHLGFHTHLTHIPRQSNKVVLIGGEGYIGAPIVWSSEF